MNFWELVHILIDPLKQNGTGDQCSLVQSKTVSLHVKRNRLGTNG